MANTTRTWNNYILERRYEVGYAATRNRGRYTGTKLHALVSDYIIGLVDPSITPSPNTVGERFIKSGKPVLFSCQPSCGCTQGQHAATPLEGATREQVTCTRCGC